MRQDVLHCNVMPLHCLLCCRVWDVKSGEMMNTLIHHCEAVLHLRFCDGIMVTCSKVSLKKQTFWMYFYTILLLLEREKIQQN